MLIRSPFCLCIPPPPIYVWTPEPILWNMVCILRHVSPYQISHCLCGPPSLFVCCAVRVVSKENRRSVLPITYYFFFAIALTSLCCIWKSKNVRNTISVILKTYCKIVKMQFKIERRERWNPRNVVLSLRIMFCVHNAMTMRLPSEFPVGHASRWLDCPARAEDHVLQLCKVSAERRAADDLLFLACITFPTTYFYLHGWRCLGFWLVARMGTVGEGRGGNMSVNYYTLFTSI
jgi:hypothetical protein